MTITALQVTGITTDNAASAVKAFASNVAAGSLIVIGCSKYDPTHTFAVGDCTKSAGTATIGAFTLDEVKHETTGNNVTAAVWSAIVTGAGSLTITVAGAAGSYYALGISEFASTSGWDSSRVEQHTNAQGATTTQATSSLTSAGPAIFFGVTSVEGSGNTGLGVGSGFTSIWTETDASAHEPGCVEYKIVSTGTSQTISTGSITSDPFAIVGVVYKEVAAASGGINTSTVLNDLSRNRPGRGPYSSRKYFRQIGSMVPSPTPPWMANLLVQTTSTADLTTQITMAAAVQSQATLTPGLTTQITPAATVQAQTTVVGALTTQITPAASVQAQTTVTPSLTTAIRLAAAVQCSTTASGTLIFPNQFAASVQCATTMVGALSTSITLQATLQGVTTMTVTTLNTAIPLAASISCVVTCSGDIPLFTFLFADLTAIATVTADLTASHATSSAIATVMDDLRRNRPGRGPYSSRNYFRQIGALNYSAAPGLTAGINCLSTVTGDLTTSIALAASVQCATTVTAPFTTSGPTLDQDWTNRSTGSGVFFAQNFNTAGSVSNNTWPDATASRVSWDNTIKRSGAGAVRFTKLASDGAASGLIRLRLDGVDSTSGSSTVGRGPGTETYYQCLVYTPEPLLRYKPTHSAGGEGGLKLLWVSGGGSSSNTDAEIVTTNLGFAGIPVPYYQNAGGFQDFNTPATTPNTGSSNFRITPAIDAGTPATPTTDSEYARRYGQLYQNNTPGFTLPNKGEWPNPGDIYAQGYPDPNVVASGVPYLVPDGWTCLMLRVVRGTANTPTSTVEFWAGRPGDNPVKIISATNVTMTATQHGALWFGAYDTNRDPNSPGVPDTFMVATEFIASSNPIPWPGVLDQPLDTVDSTTSLMAMESLSRNRPGRGPWSLGRYFRPIGSLETKAPLSAALQALVQSTTTVSGSLTTAIPMAASAFAQTTLAAALNTIIPLQATLQCVTTFTAPVLNTAIAMAAAVQSSTTITAPLTTAIPLAASVAAQTTVAPSLTTAIPLAAAVQARTTITSPVLTTAIALVANPQAQTTVTAALFTGGATIAADVQSRVTCSADLTTAIPLNASPVAMATIITANLLTAIRMAAAVTCRTQIDPTLAGSPQSFNANVQCATTVTALFAPDPASFVAGVQCGATVTPVLTTAIRFQSAVQARVDAAADLTTAILMRVMVQARTTCTANWPGDLPHDLERTLFIAAEDRTIVVHETNRNG